MLNPPDRFDRVILNEPETAMGDRPVSGPSQGGFRRLGSRHKIEARLQPLRRARSGEDPRCMGLQEFEGFDEAVKLRLVSAVDRLTEDFDGLYDREAIRALVDESVRELSGGALTPYVPILAERFARERLRARAQAEGRLEKLVPEVVFVSLTGSGRAEIGAALFKRAAGESASVHSAGSQAVSEIDENVKVAMEEIGIDLSEAFTKPLTHEVLAGADVVVTMGRSVGPVEIPETVRRVDWRVGDPAGAPLDEVRRVRDDIQRRVAELAAELVAEPIAT
jgi:arsenate reductase (thioredoxin)